MLRYRRRREASFFAINCRRGFDQYVRSIRQMQIEHPIRRRDRSPTKILLLPRHFARREVDRNEFLAHFRSIQMIAHDDGAPWSIWQSARKVNLFRRHTVARSIKMHRSTADTSRTAVYKLTTRNRREILRRSFRDIRITPQELTRLRINPDQTFTQKLYVLFAARTLHDDRRRITSIIATRHG